MNIVMLGRSIASSWGNAHATTYRALVRGLASRGHAVTFLEREVPSHAEHRDAADLPYCRIGIYRNREHLERAHAFELRTADLVIVGSGVPDGIAVADVALRTARGCTAFYDIDTPVTLASLQQGMSPYIAREQVPQFDLYLSCAGGPTLLRLQRQFGARRARALYGSVDPELHRPEAGVRPDCDLGFLGGYSDDRQPAVDALLLGPARAWSDGRFVLAGAQYPASIVTTANVERATHLPPAQHRRFYTRQRFTLNVTRRDMIASGFAPSVRLFEAAACGTPILSDSWPGLNTLFTPGREILIVRSTEDVLGYLRNLPEAERVRIGSCARHRVLTAHTGRHRAIELEQYVAQAAAPAMVSRLAARPA